MLIQTGRWMVPDPAQQFPSPYVGMGNQWVSGVDPDGRFVWFAPILIRAAIGAGSFAVAYSATALANNNFNWVNLGKSAALGAVSGAISGGISSLGGITANNISFNFMSNTASNL